MEAIDKLKANIDEALIYFDDIIGQAAMSQEEEAIRLQKEQLEKGQLSDGNATPTYSIGTLISKQNDPNRTLFGNGVNYSLFDRGSLHAGMYATYNNGLLHIDSRGGTRDPFDLWSITRNGFGLDRFLGLTPTSQDNFVERISPQVQQSIFNIILR